MTSRRTNQQLSPRLLWVAVVTLVVALLAYSQAVAYFGNESFHLLAAQLINAGKKPYLDFFYQHPPLFVYLNAVWMRIFGETWRSAHVLSALLTGGYIAVVANYVYIRLSDTRWRLAISATTAALLGLNFYVVSYGTVALPFGLCLLLTVVSFRLTVKAVYRPGSLFPFLAGLTAGETGGTKLLRIAAKARKEGKFKFTSLYHLMNEELLLECFMTRNSVSEGSGLEATGQYRVVQWVGSPPRKV